MLYNYFTKLGSITYNGYVVNNIITSIRFKEAVNRAKVSFYPYIIKEGQRPDHIAYDYYDDSRYAWLVLLSNQVIDPYYQWPLSSNQFNDVIIKKYGSVENAISRVHFYRNNFKNDDTILDTAGYGALSTNQKKYYKEILGYGGVVIGYDRRRDESAVESNRVIEFSVNSVSGLVIGERVTQKTSGTITGAATLKAINSNTLVCSQVFGTFSNTGGSVGSLIGTESNSTKSVTSNATTIYSNIPTTEASFYSEVSSYTYEEELNESRKSINLISRDNVLQIEDQIRELMT
jgi:hypothetical protein